jgi:hypothetical protein
MGGLNLIEIGVTVVWWRLTLRTKTGSTVAQAPQHVCCAASTLLECTGQELSADMMFYVRAQWLGLDGA